MTHLVRDAIILNSCVSYSGLVALISDKMKIDMMEYTIDISWRHALVFSSGFSYICMGIHSDESVMYMYNEAQYSTRHLELFVEYTPVRIAEIPPIVDNGIETSAGVELTSFDSGMNKQTNVADTGDVGMYNQVDVADVRDDVSDSINRETENRDELSLAPYKANTNCGEEFVGNVSSTDKIVCKPVVRVEQPLPQDVHAELPFLRSLPCEVGSYEVPNFEGNEAKNNMDWDENNPTCIGLGTKIDSKLQLKTAITLWHFKVARQYKVTGSSSKRWAAVCKYPLGVGYNGYVTDAIQAGACHWEISVIQSKDDGMWEIRKWVRGHTCPGN